METQWLYVLNFLYNFVLYPLIFVLTFLLTWAYLLLSWIVSPLIYIGGLLVQISLFPLRILAKFETFYIFFGAAVLLGIASGLILHVISRFSSHLFGLDPSSDGERRPTGHSAASYRAARERKRKLDKEISNAAKARMQALDPLLRESLQHAPSGRISIPQSPSTPRRRDSLLATTILEEVDDSEEDYGF